MILTNSFCIDGQDGVGKATQTNLLVKRLNKEGFPARIVSFPRYETPTGQLVYEYLHGRFGDPTNLDPFVASSIFARDREAAIIDLMKWSREEIIIFDRYVSSNLAHQGGKISNLGEREDLIDKILRLEFNLLGIPEPYLTIILGVSPEISFELSKQRVIQSGKNLDGHEVNFEHIQNAAEVYRYLAVKRSTFYRIMECCDEGRLLPPEVIHEKIWLEFGPIIRGEKCR